MQLNLGNAYRPALARLRRSTACGVFGLAAIAIAGCAPKTICHEGEAYMQSEWGSDAYLKGRPYRAGESVECVNRSAVDAPKPSEGGDDAR